MKLSFLIIILLAMSFYSFLPGSNDQYIHPNASQALAGQVVDALRKTSSAQYADLAPTVKDFKMIMQGNADLYGDHLTEAQEAFAADYLANTIPVIKQSFDALIDQGKKRGIDWNTITLICWETVDLAEGELTAAPFVIAIESDGKMYRIELEKALYLNGHWYVSQYIKLI